MSNQAADVKKTAFNVPHAQSSVRGDMVFLAGMVGVTPGTKNEGLGFRAQAKLALDNLIAVAKQDGMEPRDFVKCNVYLTDMNNYDVFSGIYKEYFGEELPALAAMAIPNLPGPFEIEIDGFGFKSEARERMKKQIISTDRAPRFDNAAQGVKIGNFIYPSLQYPVTPGDNWTVEGFDNQIRQCLDNMIAVVEAAGGTKDDIIKVTVILRDKDLVRFDDFNKVYAEYFDRAKNPPARSCYGAESFPGYFEVAAECVAYVGKDVERLRSEDAPIFNLPFCQGVRAENMVFVSGQVGYDQHTKSVPTTFEGQTRQMMKNMMAVAKVAGASPDDFVKALCFVTDIRQFDFFNRIYKEYLGKSLPARSTYEVTGLAYDYIVEIDGIACLD